MFAPCLIDGERNDNLYPNGLWHVGHSEYGPKVFSKASCTIFVLHNRCFLVFYIGLRFGFVHIPLLVCDIFGAMVAF